MQVTNGHRRKEQLPSNRMNSEPEVKQISLYKNSNLNKFFLQFLTPTQTCLNSDIISKYQYPLLARNSGPNVYEES